MTNRQISTRRAYSLLLAMVALGCTVAWATVAGRAKADRKPEASARRPLPVTVTPAEKVEHITRTRQFTGTIKAARESQLSFERPGRIVALTVEEGDRVEAGQLLARLDVEQVASRLEGVNAQLAKEEAVLAELVSGPRQETIASMEATVASLRADVQRLRLNFERSERLLGTAAISRERFDEAKYRFDTALAQQDASQKQLDELLAGTRGERLDAQRAIVQGLKAQAKTLRLDLEDGQLRAPFSGRIAERVMDEGTVVSPGATALKIVEDHRLEAWIGLPTQSSASLKIGESYVATAGGMEVAAVLRSLRPQLDPVTRTQNAVFELSEPTGLVPGQIARLNLSEHIDASGLLVPSSALVPGNRGLWNVRVVRREGDRSVAEQRDVEVLYALNDASLVTGTLMAGDLVVTDGAHRVVAGQAVTPVVRAGRQSNE